MEGSEMYASPQAAQWQSKKYTLPSTLCVWTKKKTQAWHTRSLVPVCVAQVCVILIKKKCIWVGEPLLVLVCKIGSTWDHVCLWFSSTSSLVVSEMPSRSEFLEREREREREREKERESIRNREREEHSEQREREDRAVCTLKFINYYWT